MHYEIKKIDIWTLARYSGVFFFLPALIPMVVGLLTMALYRYGRFDFQQLFFIVLPLLVYVVGFLVGLIFGLIYNVLAGRIGGIRLEIDYSEEQK